MKIEQYKNGGSVSNKKKQETMAKALVLALKLYNEDVQARRERERDEELNEEFDSDVVMGDRDTDSNKWAIPQAAAYLDKTGIHINPKLVAAAAQDEDDMNFLIQTIMHEEAHADQYQVTEKEDGTITVTDSAGLHINITPDELDYLNEAYKGIDPKYDNSIEEKHAFNRALRTGVIQLFEEKKGRMPDNPDELDNFIDQDLRNTDIKKLMTDPGSVDGIRYYKAIKSGDSSFDAIKQAMKHVAYNGPVMAEQVALAKAGAKIHIKKSHEGRFTDYCGGDVTGECIARGKASSNPKVRKMATFAANARKWKH